MRNSNGLQHHDPCKENDLSCSNSKVEQSDLKIRSKYKVEVDEVFEAGLELPSPLTIDLRNHKTRMRGLDEIEFASPLRKCSSMVKKMMQVEKVAQPTIVPVSPMDKKRYWTVDDFEFGPKLGDGTFGRVYAAKEKRSGYKVAIKVLYKSQVVRHGVAHQIRRELVIQAALNHPNILRLHAYFFDEQRIYIVLELAVKGDLHMELKREGRFSEEKAARYIVQVADALMYLHSKNSLHRDLKPENILRNHRDQIKLADFGSAVHAPSSQRLTMCGTQDYLPIEVVEGRPHNEMVDNWSLGILVYELVVGKPPFESDNMADTISRIKKLDLVFPEHVSPSCRSFIRSLLRRNPQDRLPLDQVRNDPFIRKYVSYKSE